MSTVADNRGGWWPWIREPFAGAFQRDIEWTADTVLAHHAVYTCVSLISNDVGKLRPRLVEQDSNGIWKEVAGFSPFAAVLQKPNRYQNHIQFKEWWITSKLIRGNTYVLKERDARGVVVALYILDPSRVQVLVTPDGSVYYRLGDDNLTGLKDNGVTVPASEIIHDRMNCLFHPLVGVSPIFACGAAANIGLKIETNSAGFFDKGSNPSGIVTAPGVIDEGTAQRMSDRWAQLYSGENSGRVAVLGNGLTFVPMRMSAVDSQLIEHLKWSAETVCSTFHVPPFKVGLGQMPTYQNGETLNQIYYSDCLQSHIEQFELCSDEGLGLGVGTTTGGRTMGVDLDLTGLFRMDSATQVKTLGEAVKSGIMAPNEARREIELPPADGGDTPFLQQQNYPLAALHRPVERPAAETPQLAPPDEPEADDEQARSVLMGRLKAYYPEALAA
jgi:HK97 family phage portal protein